MRILGLAEHDPRLEANGITADRISFLGEKMVDWGLDPNEVSEEAFLKARDRFLRGRIELEDVIPLVRRFQAQYDQRDIAIAESVAEQRDGSTVSRPTESKRSRKPR
jgi:hypothetical protein